MVKCAKCGEDIPAGQEVKKGFLIKKNYHKECVSIRIEKTCPACRREVDATSRKCEYCGYEFS